MKKFTFLSLAVFFLLTLTSCDAIGTIFKAGMWWGFILVAAVIALIIWLFTRGRNS
ncbi:phosphatidate cytidylyltransferase [Kaistella palustris]|uniref:phosphatidate cytidylyltransferase n=1 Tax=Kaistella palustris TaxID=493376 RepID=UPI0004113385|nr:phosphatidate cytidylyltransferase [Kaistella palustris]